MNQVRHFFEASDFTDHEVLRPLSHIRPNWELAIDSTTGIYVDEEGSFAWLLSHLIDELTLAVPPSRYHDTEDRLGEHVQKSLNWNIRKHCGIWVNADGVRLNPSDYLALLEQGAYKKDGDADLVEAASGRVWAAILRGQICFDEMERSHQVILAGVLAAILYHREPHEGTYRERATKQV